MFVSKPALAQRFECRAKFGRKNLRLLARGEVTAFVDLLKVDQVTIGAWQGQCHHYHH
jgi:hypothetical protein